MAKTAADASLEYEAGQTPTAMSALTDSGDHKKFTSAASLFSGVAGFTPVIRPNGVITGGAVTPGVSGTDDKVDVAALTVYLAGTKTTVAAALDQTITRGASTNICIINSITINSLGAVAVIAGTATTAFSETRGADGGPPFIPVGSVEVAQVRLSSITAAAITAEQIYAVPGTHLERYDYPLFEEDYATGTVSFNTALPLSHTGGVAKKVFASYSAPVFAFVTSVSDFVAPENSYSSSSKQVYGGTVGSSSTSLKAGGFNAYLRNGVSDALIGLAGKNLWFRFYPDKYQTDYILSQGTLGVERSFPAGDNINAKCTISPLKASVNVVA